MSLTAEQLESRKSGITATDAVAISGMSKYGDPVSVYIEKTQPDLMAERKAEGAAQKGLGHKIEPIVMELLAEERGLVLAPVVDEHGSPMTVRSPVHTWAMATPDRYVVEPEGKIPPPPSKVRTHVVAVAEAKNVGLRMLKDWRADRDPNLDTFESFEAFQVPDYVHVQAQWQMIVTNTRKCFVAALLGGRDFRSWEVHHEDALAETLLNVCGDFWHRNVLKRIPPVPGAHERAEEAIRLLYPKSSGAVITSTATAEEWADQYIEARARADYYEGLYKKAQHALMIECGSNVGITGGDWKLSWKSASSGGVDYKGMAHELAGGSIPDDVMRKFSRPGSRRFLLTPSKARKAMAKSNGPEAMAMTQGEPDLSGYDSLTSDTEE